MHVFKQGPYKLVIKNKLDKFVSVGESYKIFNFRQSLTKFTRKAHYFLFHQSLFTLAHWQTLFQNIVFNLPLLKILLQ